MGHENGGWMNEEQRAASETTMATEREPEGESVMKEAYIPYDLRPGNALAERLLQPDVEIANLTALREADQATIAALGLVNKELADALEIAWRAGRFVDAEPAVVDRAERALRAAGRLKGENDA